MTCLVATTADKTVTPLDTPFAKSSTITSSSSVYRQSIQRDLEIMLRQQYANRVNASTLMIPILIRAFGPLPPIISFSLPANATVAFILATIIRNLRLPARVAQMLRLTRLGGQSVNANTPISSLAGPAVRNGYGQMVQQPITLEVRMGTRGGKGGFGSQLRAAGGKMSSARNAEENRDSCRDLNGRRLSTIKQARQLAAYLATQDERQRALSEAQKKKYAKLEKMLGRKPKEEADFVEAAQKLHEEGGELNEDEKEGDDDKGEGSSRIITPIITPNAISENRKGEKRERIEDSEYVEQSREIVENVRSAVASAMRKKKKKGIAGITNGKDNRTEAGLDSQHSVKTQPTELTT